MMLYHEVYTHILSHGEHHSPKAKRIPAVPVGAVIWVSCILGGQVVKCCTLTRHLDPCGISIFVSQDDSLRQMVSYHGHRNHPHKLSLKCRCAIPAAFAQTHECYNVAPEDRKAVFEPTVCGVSQASEIYQMGTPACINIPFESP